MKILVVGALGKGALENYYIKGIKRCDVVCDSFDISKAYYSAISKGLFNKVVNKLLPNYFFDPINKALIEFVNNKIYDAIIVFKGLTLYPETIRNLKLNCKIVCCYNPDHPFKFFSPGSGNNNILNSINEYDLYITYASKISKELKENYGKESFVLPFAYDDDLSPRPGAFQELAGKFTFIGAYDNERKNILESINSEDLVIYGDSKWGSRTSPFSRLRKYYTQKSLYDQEYIDAISSSEAVFNFLRKQNLEEESHNMRSFEVPGYGGLMVSNRTEEQSLFFDEDKEAIYFDSIDELKDKLKYLKKNARLVVTIKRNAFDKCRKAGYGYSQRSQTLVRQIRSLI